LDKFTELILILIATIVTSGCCVTKNVEAEETGSIIIEIDTVSPTQPLVEIPVLASPVQYELPDRPLGYRPYYPDDIPEDIWEAAVKWGNEYDVSPDLLCAIGYKETRLQNINSANGLYHGVMQIHPPSHRRRMKEIGVTDLSDVSQNVHVAAHYIRELLDDQNDIAIALMRYHGEPKSNIIRYQNTGKMSSYAKSILDHATEYEAYHGRGGVYE